MPVLLTAFVLVCVATAAFGLALRARQAAHVARHRNAVPAAFADAMTLAEHQRAADYERARLRLGAAASVFSLAVALGWALWGYGAMYATMATVLSPGVGRSTVFLLAVGAVSWLLALPFAALRTFGVEQRFGFNLTTPRLFALDRLKSAALSLAIGTPLLAALMLLMRQEGAWWLWAWLGVLAVGAAGLFLYPRWIAPLFNRYVPLAGRLRGRLDALLRRCGYRAEVFVVDASRRSAHGNAYFYGFGPAKRIVLFDTFLTRSSEAEVEAVLAHELGHFKLRHVLTGLLRSAALTFLAFFAVGWLCRQPWLLPGFGITQQDPALALLVCALVLDMAGPLLALAGNWLSRRHEYQADDFARRMVGAEPLVSALVRLSRDNAATLTVDPLYALVAYTHPPLPLRVERLRAA